MKEFRHALKGLKIRLLSLDQFPGAPEVAETGRTLESNAMKKARAISRFTGYPALADDTGLEVKALGGLPGVKSARYAGPTCLPADNIRKLLKALAGKTGHARRAQFRCIIAYVTPQGRTTLMEGRCSGRIADTPRGKKGFGYDPIFIPSSSQKTFAEMSLAEKQRLSHRGKALRRLTTLLGISLLVGCGGQTGVMKEISSGSGQKETMPVKVEVGEKRFTVAVMEFSAQNVQPMVGTIVAGVVRNRIVDSQGFMVLEQQAMDLILQEQAFQKSGCTTAECAVEIGKLLNARFIVVGEVTKLGREYEVLGRVVDVETRAIRASASYSVREEEALRYAAGEVADRLIGTLTGRPGSKVVDRPPFNGTLPERQPFVRPERRMTESPIPANVAPLENGALRQVEPSLLPVRSRHSSIVDSVRGRVVVFGGSSVKDGTAAGDLGDTWIFDGATQAWSEIKGEKGPAARAFHTATYDRKHDRMILVGGYEGHTKVHGDTWIFDLKKNQWNQVLGEMRGPARWGHAAVLDLTRNRLIVVGGRGPLAAGGQGLGEHLNDTWIMNLDTFRWQEIKSQKNFMPRQYLTATLDPLRDRLIVVGGEDATGRRFGDAWALDLKNDQWQPLGDPNVLPPRAAHTATFDPKRNRLVVIGGIPLGVGDTWTLDLKTAHWSQMKSQFSSPRFFHTATHDPAKEYIWITGGFGDHGTRGDVWVLDLRRDEIIRIGEEKITPGRHIHTADLIGDQLVIVGGQTDGPSSLGDSWLLDLLKAAKGIIIQGKKESP